MNAQTHALKPADLYQRCDPDQFTFASTAELPAGQPIIGQERAEDAVKFGIGIQRNGYNLFALGPKGSGKYTAMHHYLAAAAAAAPAPPDWCYLYNFDQPHEPRALSLPAGTGSALQTAMKTLGDELGAAIPAAFESQDYQAQRQNILAAFQGRQEEAVSELQASARERGIALLRTQNGLAFAPMRDEEVMPPEAFQELPQAEREQLEADIEEMQEALQRIAQQLPRWNRESREEVKKLNQEIVALAIDPLINEVKAQFADHEALVAHLTAVREDILENLELFRQTEQDNEGNPLSQLMARGNASTAQMRANREQLLRRYHVNLVVNNEHQDGAPIVHENHPTHQNLIGRVEHQAQMGALITDFNLIRAGALHRANGGYLLLDARKLLQQPYAWESLKRALQAQEIRIESLGQSLSLISTVSLEPEPIPLDLKVILLGERQLYYLLYQLEPEFAELFKVAVDFEDQIARDGENQALYAELVATLVAENELRPLVAGAVARVVEYGSRYVGDREKLSTSVHTLTDLLIEADHAAAAANSDQIKADHVQQALDAQSYRNGRIRDRLQEAILRDTVLIDTEGHEVGQINGLAVLQAGNFSFGKPNRISARVRLGKGEVIDIERQVEMGGPIHSKGVMILAGFLGGRFAAKQPLSLSASLVFEQSYGGVDGDSASSAELYALLSALADVPIRQELAVTGSVNQHGQVQAIGGVNDKIEGFFDICQARGLTGEQGVLIPAANVKNLMLRRDVLEAVAENQFHIYAVRTIDEGIELLTGVPAGVPDNQGNYPSDTINYRVAQRLQELAEKQQQFGQPSAQLNGNKQ
ncbi:MAG: AAA family ATPase [Anaerolineales bacterium]|nr:AAA family ATPase [Anaerolineales bacterium]